MDLRTEIALAQSEGYDRDALYAALLASTLYVRTPTSTFGVSQPDTGRLALPAFLEEAEAISFWAVATPEQQPTIVSMGFPAIAEAGRSVGALVIDPMAGGLLLDRAELTHLAAGEMPGAFTAWLRSLDRLARQSSEVITQLRGSHVHVITGRGADGEQRVYLLEKSEDGTQAVACFSSPATLAQFADVRRLFEGHHDYAVGLVTGAQVMRMASGLGAYILIDPESPWETQVEPTLPS
jgi:hypothetical protein